MSAVHHATSLDDAVQILGELGEDAGVVGGGTWVMLDWTRGVYGRSTYVSLTRVPGLAEIIDEGSRLVVGATTTHARLGATIPSDGPAGALGEAARTSAFPAVRNVATIAGNIAAEPFPEADLVPAMIALGAQVTLRDGAGDRSIDVADYLIDRAAYANTLICAVTVPMPHSQRSCFARQTVRGGAEHPLAAVAMSFELDGDGVVSSARVAVGAVEERARRVPEAEEAFVGRRPDDATSREAGVAAAEVLTAREARDAPGWYRLKVLPGLFARATAGLRSRA